MLPVARSPSTSQLSMSFALPTGSTKMRASFVPSMRPSVWMCVPCLMPDAKLHEPVRLKPPFVGFAMPGRVPCPAMTGKRGPANSSLTASSFR